MRFYKDPESGISRYGEVKLVDAFESVNRINYMNTHWELTTNTKRFAFDPETTDIYELDNPPVPSGLVAFDSLIQLVVFLATDMNHLSIYNPSTLVLTYQDDPYYEINLKNIRLRGTTTMDDLIVGAQAKIKKLEAGKILITSRFPNVIIA
jgi:hypothetical protein